MVCNQCQNEVEQNKLQLSSNLPLNLDCLKYVVLYSGFWHLLPLNTWGFLEFAIQDIKSIWYVFRTMHDAFNQFLPKDKYSANRNKNFIMLFNVWKSL